jgi:hypothetical protein
VESDSVDMKQVQNDADELHKVGILLIKIFLKIKLPSVKRPVSFLPTTGTTMEGLKRDLNFQKWQVYKGAL